MKKTILLLLTAITSYTAFSQTSDELAELRKIFGQEKKDLMGQFLSLSPTDSAKFWPLYDEYSVSRKALADDRISIIKDYASQYANITDAQANSLTERYFKNESSILKLQEKYYKKISKSVSPLKATQFMQAEQYLQTQIRAAVQDEIPFIGEFEKKKH
jgi:hypothetical protein